MLYGRGHLLAYLLFVRISPEPIIWVSHSMMTTYRLSFKDDVFNILFSTLIFLLPAGSCVLCAAICHLPGGGPAVPGGLVSGGVQPGGHADGAAARLGPRHHHSLHPRLYGNFSLQR
jgi:hypothetical protein